MRLVLPGDVVVSRTAILDSSLRFAGFRMTGVALRCARNDIRRVVAALRMTVGVGYGPLGVEGESATE